MQVLALTSSAGRVAGLRAQGARPLVGNLDAVSYTHLTLPTTPYV